MDIFLIVLASFLMLLGILGSFLPVLPGPITGWFGFLLLYFSSLTEVSKKFLIITLIIAVLIWLLDYFIPAMGTKKFGGSRAGMIGRQPHANAAIAMHEYSNTPSAVHPKSPVARSGHRPPQQQDQR